VPNRVALSEQIADRVRDLRNRLGLSREELAASARVHGAAADFTHQSVTFLENGRPNEGVRTRLFALDELWAVADALEVTPLELLGDTAPLFVGDRAAVEVVCPSCRQGPGDLEQATRSDLAKLGDLGPLELTIAETAYLLAATIDLGGDAKSLPALTKELRACVEQLAAGRRRQQEPDEDDFGDLDELD
jgi:transcriptional regulator with XRE-family HTH domain